MLKDSDFAKQGFVELGVFHGLFAMVLWCYVQCRNTSPGHVSDEVGYAMDTALSSREKKRKMLGGGVHLPRQCQKCDFKFKPDRAHHCKRCGVCVLKMDHHCVWVDGCVGQNNYKYFVLL